MSENRGLSVPGQQQRIPGVPESVNIIVFEQFSGLNTKPPRIAIAPTECSWLDGFMPVTPTTLRTLYGPSTPVYTAPDGRSIIFFANFNLGDIPHKFILLDDGSCYDYNEQTTTTSLIAPAGTLPSVTTIGTAQWGSQYFLFCAATATGNGYFIYDGNNLYQAGTIGPVVDVTNGGFNYTSPPIVTLYGGSGSGASFTAMVQNGSVISVTDVTAGSGYSISDPTPLVLFSGGNGTRTAYGSAGINNGVITNVTLTNGGAGYQNTSGVQQPPTVTITDSTGTGASISVSQMSGGQVISLQVNGGGMNYLNPTITFTPTGSSGSGAAAIATVESGVIVGVSITDSGLGYANITSIDFISTTGAGAVAKASLTAGGSISTVTVTAGGSGYSAPCYWIAEGDGPAFAMVELMPFGISGTAIETFQSRVWIANGSAMIYQNRVIFSAAGDPANFNPADGAGSFLSNDSFLRTGYFGLKQTNGFLYVIGDSSENAISGVQTTSPSSSAATSSVITTFNNQNSDPQFGTAWPASIQVFSRNILFANAYGVMISYGGAVTKISDALDGIFQSEISFTPSANYSSAIATIFGSLVYMLLIPVADPILNTSVNKLMMWNGKQWWTFPASTYTFIASKEIDSVLTAWATDGTHIFELFQSPNNTISKVIQTRLYVDPSYWTTKTAIRLSGIIEADINDESINISIDSEIGVPSPYVVPATTTSPVIFGPLPVGQQGRSLGMTLTTNASDITVVSLSMAMRIESPNI